MNVGFKEDAKSTQNQSAGEFGVLTPLSKCSRDFTGQKPAAYKQEPWLPLLYRELIVILNTLNPLSAKLV